MLGLWWERIIATMNYKFKKADDLFEKTGKSMLELIDELQGINENDPATKPNETTITGEDGEEIILSIDVSEQGTRWTITKDGLKLEMFTPNDKS